MKKNILSIGLIIFTYVLPEIYSYQHQNDAGFYDMQFLPLKVLLTGSLVLAYINWKKQKDYKISSLIFKIIGILGIIYSGGILFLLYSMSNMGLSL